MKKFSILCTISILTLAACKEEKVQTVEQTAASTSVVEQAESQPAPKDVRPMPSQKIEEWVGKWNGVEGTFLEIKPDGKNYKITIQNLDGPREFKGEPKDGVLWFDRDGKSQGIRPGNGGDTGMKWLAEKKDCLVVSPVEGYCRD